MCTLIIISYNQDVIVHTNYIGNDSIITLFSINHTVYYMVYREYNIGCIIMH